MICVLPEVLQAPVLGLLQAADPSAPGLKHGLTADQVGPGVIGFIATFVMALGIILLGLDMTRRQRRLKNRYDYAMAREAEERARHEQAGSTAAAAGPTEEDPAGSHRPSEDPRDPEG